MVNDTTRDTLYTCDPGEVGVQIKKFKKSNGQDSIQKNYTFLIPYEFNQIGMDIDGQGFFDRSGAAVSLSADGRRVAIGSPTSDGNGTAAGHVRIFSLDIERDTFKQSFSICQASPLLPDTIIYSSSQGTCDSLVITRYLTDSLAPQAICQNFTLDLDTSGKASLDPLAVGGNPSDACGIMTYKLSQENFTCDDVGSNQVTLTVTDSSGFANTCQVGVMVRSSQACTQTSVGFSQNLSVKAYPNPYDEELYLQFHQKKSAEVHLVIYDMLGKVVQEFREFKGAGTHLEKFDFHGLPAGIYSLNLVSGQVRKVIQVQKSL